MIEILNYRPVNKGALVGYVNINIVKWGLTINKISIFFKDSKRWINLPQENYESNGEKKYFPLVRFNDSQVSSKFQQAVLSSFDEWMKNNPVQSNQKISEHTNHEEFSFQI